MDYKYFSSTINGQIEETYLFLPHFSPRERIIFGLLNTDFFKPFSKEGYTTLINKKEFGLEINIVDKSFELKELESIAKLSISKFRLFAEDMINNAVNIANGLELLKYSEFDIERKEINTNILNIPRIFKLEAKVNPCSTEYIGYNISKGVAEDITNLVKRFESLQGSFEDYAMDFNSGVSAINDWIDAKVKPGLETLAMNNLRIESLERELRAAEKQIVKLNTHWYNTLWNFITFHWERI